MMQDQTFVPGENHQIYVTASSARKAAYEIIQRAGVKYRSELAHQREEVFNEIIDKHIPFALPTNEEMKMVHLTRQLPLKCGKYEYVIYDLHREIKPLAEPVEIPLTLYLALNELDRWAIEMKEQEERASDRLFAELMYMRDKEHIEACLPEIMPFLQFEPFIYETEYWKDICLRSKES